MLVNNILLIRKEYKLPGKVKLGILRIVDCTPLSLV